MPTYQFECAKCSHKFNLFESMKDHERHQEHCPKCGSSDVRNLISAVSVKTSKKS
jgi:putative FmdB family regulatory protein